ncbi:MAG TPA: ABC transporter permease [Bacillota bacterium]|nr:ABC transporter permease [Bacillota bacterium]
MRLLWALVQRNIRTYIRDKAAIAFSLFSVLILLGLYIFFLGDLQIRSIVKEVGARPGIRSLVSSWVMAGILMVNTVTVPLGVLGTMVEDLDRKRLQDFLVSPLGRAQLIGGYLIASWIVGILISLVTLGVAEGYILLEGGQLLSATSVLKVIGLLVISTVSFSTVTFFFVSFLRTTGAYGGFSTVTGTLIGFLLGIYVPIGQLPVYVQSVIKAVPASYGTALMRQIFMEKPLQEVFSQAPQSFLESYQRIYGITIFVGKYQVGYGLILLILFLTAGLFFTLSVFKMLRKAGS